MSSGKGKRPLLSAHEKVEAIRRVHDGESKASVARDIGVPESTLRGWCKNEDKILFLSRQSSPESYDCEPDLKKAKYIRDVVAAAAPPALNLSGTIPHAAATGAVTTPFDASPVALTVTTGPASAEKSDAKRSAASYEREKNRAELLRLSTQLGLNRPEYNPVVGALNPLGHVRGGASAAPGTSVLSSYGPALQEMAARIWHQVNQTAAAANAVPPHKNSTSKSHQENNTLAHSNHKDTTSTSSAAAKFSLPDEALCYWLRLQQELAINAGHHQTQTILDASPTNPKHSSKGGGSYPPPYPSSISGGTTTTATTPTASPPTTTASTTTNHHHHSSSSSSHNNNNQLLLQQMDPAALGANNNNNDANGGPWFWKWYKQFYSATGGLPPTAGLLTPTENILLQQLTKNNTSQAAAANHKHTASEKNGVPKKSPPLLPPRPVKNITKVRAVLDDILQNNVLNTSDPPADVKENGGLESPTRLDEAIECGQKFLRWLEEYSDPSVTAKQVMQFKFLLNNIKLSAERRNNPHLFHPTEKVDRRKFKFDFSNIDDN